LSGYRVRLARHVEKQLRELPENVRGRVIAALRVIQNSPTAGIKLRGEFEGSRRYRVGGYRIVYQVNEPERVILIENIRHRGRAYRRR
jgi:mRNA interferase RelE/StbE